MKTRILFCLYGSLVVSVSFGQTAILLTGDIMARAEQNLVQTQGQTLSSTVLLAPHHGSRTSNSPEFIHRVAPEVVVISAGAANRFGFPHAEVTARYQAAGCRVLVTGSHGAIAMRSDGNAVHVDINRLGQAVKNVRPDIVPYICLIRRLLCQRFG